MSASHQEFTDIEIVFYTDKSIVVRGETRQYRESMRALGGKWNSNLTDRQTSEKFGGWIFPVSKMQEIKAWKQKGEHLSDNTAPQASTSFSGNSSCSTCDDVKRRMQVLEDKIFQMEKMFQSLPTGVKSRPQAVTIEFDDDEPITTPPRRLLKKK